MYAAPQRLSEIPSGGIPQQRLCLQVSHDRVPSARSSARSMHDSFTVDSPIPGERQVFSRPADQEPRNSFVQSSYSNSALPPLPEFPIYSGEAVQAGMSNPLFGEEASATDVTDGPEQEAQPVYPAMSHSVSQPYAVQPQDAYNAYSAHAQQQDDLATADAGDYSMLQHSIVPSADVSRTAEPVYPYAAPSTLAPPRQSSDTAPYTSTASAQSPDTAAAPNSLRQAANFTLHHQQAVSSVDPPASPSRSARSSAEMLSPPPTTPGVVDSPHHSFQLPDSDGFTPVHSPLRRPSRSSSSGQPTQHNSSDMQYMQPAPGGMRGGHEAAADQQGYASSREGYHYDGGDYREQYAAASRPASGQRRQRSHPPRPYSPMPGRVPSGQLLSSTNVPFKCSVPPTSRCNGQFLGTAYMPNVVVNLLTTKM